MNYCVLVHISKSTISFWYQQEGASFEPLSLSEGNALPMYFYANENDFILGANARERFLNGDQINAFGNYFDIITNPSSFFNVYGNKKHVKFLLYYAVEQYLSHFINSVLYKNESIEGYRNNFPLRFIFSQDIAPKEKLLVESIFKESGYDNISSISYSKNLFEHLFNNGVVKRNMPTILLTGIDGNLYIELFSTSYENPTGPIVLEDEGADPRIKIMAKMIYDDAMASTRMSLQEKTEIAHLIPYALDFLAQDSAIPKGDVLLSDGTTCWVKIKRKDLDDRLLYYEGDNKINKSIEKLVSTNNVQLTAVQIVLNGDSLNTSFFLDRLKKKFNHVEGVPPNTENEVTKLLFQQIANAGYTIQNYPAQTIAEPSSKFTTNSFQSIGNTPVRTAAPSYVSVPPARSAPPPVTIPPSRAGVPPARTAPPPVTIPPSRAGVPPARTAPPPIAAPPPRATVPPHIISSSAKLPPPPPPPPPSQKANLTNGISSLDSYEKRIKSAIGDEAKISKLKKSDFGQIVDLLKNDNILYAVKTLKDKTGLSLKRSKDIIDSLNIK